jgi:hypothetical protein
MRRKLLAHGWTGEPQLLREAQNVGIICKHRICPEPVHIRITDAISN